MDSHAGHRLGDAALIERYFTAEARRDRDAALTLLLQNDSPAVRAFLRALLVHDVDDAARLDAAAQLARWQEPEGLAFLDGLLEAPSAEPEDFAMAVRVLRELPPGGAALGRRLVALWQAPERPRRQRLQALQALADADEAQACAAYTSIFARSAERCGNGEPVDAAEVEAACAGAVRLGCAGASAALERLLARLSPGSDSPGSVQAERRAALRGLASEALALLAA